MTLFSEIKFAVNYFFSTTKLSIQWCVLLDLKEFEKQLVSYYAMDG